VTTYKELLERARYLADQPPPPGKSASDMVDAISYVFRQTDFDPYEQRMRECARLWESMPPIRWADHHDLTSTDVPIRVAPESYEIRMGGPASLPCSCHICQEAARPDPACSCGQTIWNGGSMCSDCRMGCGVRGEVPLDARISEAQHDQDPTSDWTAWAHPSSEGP
jgi:hypothetical protein